MFRRFPPHATALALLASAASAAACTLAITFKDQPSCDGGLCVVEGSDASGHDAGDAGADTGNHGPCFGVPNGGLCGSAAEFGGRYPAASDLVFCDGGEIARTYACADAGCVGLRPGTPDICNGCVGKSNGRYCGRDFSTSVADNANVLFECKGGGATVVQYCGVCKVDAGTAFCNP